VRLSITARGEILNEALICRHKKEASSSFLKKRTKKLFSFH